MLDARLRPLIDSPLDAAGRWLAERRVLPDHVTLAGFAIGMGAAAAIVLGAFGPALALIVANRIADGLDGAVARATHPTDRGAFLDITLDFVFYGAVPLAFALHEPASNALPASFLLASFLANGTAFLAFAIAAAKRDFTTQSQGVKSFFHVAGLAEGGETIAVFCAACLWPQAFPWLAFGFAALCGVSAAARILFAWRAFG